MHAEAEAYRPPPVVSHALTLGTRGEPRVNGAGHLRLTDDGVPGRMEP